MRPFGVYTFPDRKILRPVDVTQQRPLPSWGRNGRTPLASLFRHPGARSHGMLSLGNSLLVPLLVYVRVHQAGDNEAKKSVVWSG